jgi:hypothetical protein
MCVQATEKSQPEIFYKGITVFVTSKECKVPLTIAHSMQALYWSN